MPSALCSNLISRRRISLNLTKELVAYFFLYFRATDFFQKSLIFFLTYHQES
jgi:hypothetical protein